MKRRVGMEDVEEAMLGEKSGAPLSQRAEPRACGERWCCWVPLRGCAVVACLVVLVVLAGSVDPWGASARWKADARFETSGPKDTDYPQSLAYLPASEIGDASQGEYEAPISPSIADPTTYLGKTHYSLVDGTNDARASASRYFETRDGKCEWESQRPSESRYVTDFCVRMRDTPSAVTDLPYDWCDEDESFRLEFCRVPDDASSATTTNAWTIVRVGPFETTGGFDWNGIAWKGMLHDVLVEMQETRRDALYVDAAYAATVDADGRPLGFPPLHAHHFHLSPNHDLAGPQDLSGQATPLPQFYFGWSLVHELHGDTACKDDRGGSSCQYEGFPRGSAFRLDVEDAVLGSHHPGFLSVNCEFNDVRAAGSDPMPWYLEVAVHHFVAGPDRTPPDFVVSRDTVAPTFFPYPVPYYTPSVTWYSHSFAYVRPDNALVSVYAHTHSTLADAQWLFQAAPEDLGLTLDDGLALRTHLYWKDYVPAAHDLTLSQVKAKILANLARSQRAWDQDHADSANATEADKALRGYPRALCKTTSISAAFVDIDSPHGKMFDRQIPVQCAADFTSFPPNLLVTAVAFNRAGGDPHVSGVTRRVQATRRYEYYSGDMQHNFWRFVYKEPNRPDVKSKSSFYIVARSEDQVRTPSINTNIAPVPRGYAPPLPSFLVGPTFDMLKLHFFDWFA